MYPAPPTCNYRAVQILPNHHARLASVVTDYGPKADGSYLFPAYLFINEKPPPYFWGYTGVVRCLKSEVAPDELDRALMAYQAVKQKQSETSSSENLGVLNSAVISIHSIDGKCVATIELFGRNLKVRVA
jgi:hypothetical protein